MVKLVRCSESVLKATRAIYTQENLTESQFSVLEALYHVGPMSQKELGKKILKSKGNMTMVIDNLSKRRLVRCDQQISDKRFLLVQLTAQGRELIKRIFPEHAQSITKIMSGLTLEEQKTLAGLCKKLGLSAG